MGKAIQRWILAGVGGAAILFPTKLQAKSKWVVESRHLKSYEQARECSVFKAVAWNALSDQRLRERNAKAIEKLLRERRAKLDQCAASSGVVSRGESTEDDDRVKAEMCPGQYSEWLEPGYRYHSIRREIQEYDTALQTIKTVLRFRCGEKEIREINWKLPEMEEAIDAKDHLYEAQESEEVPTASDLQAQTDPEALPGAGPAMPTTGTSTARLTTPTTEFEKAVE